VGTKPEEDQLIYEDLDQPLWMFDVTVTNDGKYLILDIRKDCDDLGLIYQADLTTNAALDKKIEFSPVITEWIGGFNYIHNVGSKVFFKTNYKAPKCKVISIDLTTPEEANWTDLIPEN